jgi:hypothetical protein
MTTSTQEVSTGRRVWWFTALILTGLILVLTVGSIPGIWVARGVVLDMTSSFFAGVNELAAAGVEIAAGLDAQLADVEDINNRLDARVTELGDSVADQGAIRLLLPPEVEAQLQERIDRTRETAATIRQVATSVIQIYRTANRIPFVDLPTLNPDDVAAIENGVAQFEADVTAVRAEVQAIRDGKADSIRRVLVVTERFATQLTETRTMLATLQTRLTTLQANTAVWFQWITIGLTTAAVLISLQMAWVAYALFMLLQSYWYALYPPTPYTPLVAATSTKEKSSTASSTKEKSSTTSSTNSASSASTNSYTKRVKRKR